jgi:recombination protein RecR
MLPSFGPKLSERIALFLLKSSSDFKLNLSQKILSLKKIGLCENCNGFSSVNICPICSSPSRDSRKIAIVEEPTDIFIFERLKVWDGVYYCMHGLVDSLNGVEFEDLKINLLEDKIHKQLVTEVLFALDATPKGETTKIYLERMLRGTGIRITQLGYGIPRGGEVEFADEFTLTEAFKNRRDVSSED